jgi:hypothetical protein
VEPTEALYSDGGVKHDGSIWVRELAQGKEARRSSFYILRASRLQVEPKAGRRAGEHDYEDAEEDTELRHCMRHGKNAGTENGIQEVHDAACP